MKYVQGGANYAAVGKATKKALKEAIKTDPSSVYLYDTTAVRASEFTGTADKLPEGMTFNVVGPDPYTDRSWYASVYRNNQGTLAVK